LIPTTVTLTAMSTDGEGGTDLATVTIVFPGANDAPDAEDDSKTATPRDSVSGTLSTAMI